MSKKDNSFERIGQNNDVVILDSKLSNFVSISKEKINTTSINPNHYISTENMKQNYLGITKLEELPKSDKITKFSKNDILISNIRPYLKKIWLSEFDGGCSSDIIVLHPYNSKDSKFIYYSLTTDKFINYMMKTSKGTKMPRGDKKSILKYKLKNLNNEHKHNSINLISSLDSKIYLMEKKYNYFGVVKRFFIKKIFDDIKVEENMGCINTTLGKIADINMGFTPSTKNPTFWNGKNKCLSISDLKTKYVKETSKKNQ